MSELTELYSPSLWAKRTRNSPVDIVQYHIEFIEEASKIARETIPHIDDIPYGPMEREKLDIFGPDLNADAPILVFIHGGYWQLKALTRKSYEFIAINLYQNGIKSIFIGYELCPDVTMAEIGKQIERAATECLQYAKENQSKGLYFMGHSAGANLISNLATNWIQTVPNTDRTMIKAALLISGIYDLTPLIATEINNSLKMDFTAALKLSPLKYYYNSTVEKTSITFYTIVGEHESPEFIKQSKQFQQQLNNFNVKSHFIFIKNIDHFNIIELLNDSSFELSTLLILIINKVM